jgi:hypothetical protein
MVRIEQDKQTFFIWDFFSDSEKESNALPSCSRVTDDCVIGGQCLASV